MPFAPLLAALAEVRDPRRAQGQRYSMRLLLLFSVLAVLAGATSYQGVITFIALQRERLDAVFGACFRRAPAVNTLRHLFLALGRDELEAAFRRHARALSAGTAAEGMRTIALDGKTLRGSFDCLNDVEAAHVLSAFASDAALILAHQELAGAPGEIAAVPRLIGELGLTGVLFTADALHCQKKEFARAAATGNALLVRVKENQPTLQAALAKLCAEQRPYSRRWGIEPMFSDFKSRSFGLDDTQIRYPDRLARLVLIMALALYCAVSTGLWDQARHPLPAEAKSAPKQPKNVARSRTSWFTRGLRCIARLLQAALPMPALWATSD